ncbi:hypothetical protein DRE_00779 [Drechslerella stenobrocha 248]|uniref:G-patch domain-containing protein n=1 Tax=Drechslerella stenobrocha 248 TaxID=1043628 RepID=W7I8M3_9PEZI|nr:hypothetical protein DRE_00779 [Drechslerella stenobrocha 248]
MPVDGGDSISSEPSAGPPAEQIAQPSEYRSKRKRICFVPASSEDSGQETARAIGPNRGSSVANFYLSLVLPPKAGSANALQPSKSTEAPSLQGVPQHQLECGSSSVEDISAGTRAMMQSRHDCTITIRPSERQDIEYSKLRVSPDNLDTPVVSITEGPAVCRSEDAAVQPELVTVEPPLETPVAEAVDDICTTCKARVTDWRTHVRTTAHMVSEEHSKTPHHLNRQSEGYKHMVRMGWDPDGGGGLGAGEQGIRFPVKATTKNDTLGIGARAPKSIRDPADGVSESNPKKQRLLTAKQMQRLAKAERAARQDLHNYLRH